MILRLCTMLSLLALAACGKLAPATAGPGEACVRNADCAVPYVCIDAVCAVDLRRACENDELRCNGDAVEVCRDGGVGWDFVETCATGCTQGACNPTVCEPGAQRCEGSALYACSDDGTRWVWMQTCLSGCDGSTRQCKEAICAPFETRCGEDGQTIEACDARGTGWVTTACGAEEVCSLGRCVPVVCSTVGTGDEAVRQPRCNGDVLERCNDNGTAFVAAEACEFGCNDTNHLAACVEPACEAGATTCQGDALYRCAPDRRSMAFLNYCPAGCGTTGGVGACLAPKCVGLERRCAVDVATGEPIVEQCNASGTQWAAIESCQQSCSQGQCGFSDAGCVPGSRRCAGVESEVCVRLNALTTEWRFEQRCLGGCAGGVCEAGGACGCVGESTDACGSSSRPVVGLRALVSSEVPPRADGLSTLLVVTDVITDVWGAPVPDGTLVTFVHDGGVALFASADVDFSTPGLQRPTRHGRARVVIRAPSFPEDIAVSASVGGSCTGQTTVSFVAAADDDVLKFTYVADDFSTLNLKDRIHTTVQWEPGEGRLVAAPDFDFGTGVDGDLFVKTNSTTNLFTESYVTASNVVSMGASDVVLDTPSPRLVRGDEVLLIALTGTSAAAAGNWEFKRVASVSGSHVTFDAPVRRLYGATTNYDLSGQKVVLQKVPHFNDVTVESGATLKAGLEESNGATGVLALRARGTVRILGDVDVSGAGLSTSQPVQPTATLDKLLLGGGAPGGGIVFISARTVSLRPDALSPFSGRILARSTNGYGGSVWLKAGTLELGASGVNATGTPGTLNGRVRLDYGRLDASATTSPPAFEPLKDAFLAQSMIAFIEQTPRELRRVELLGAVGGAGETMIGLPAALAGLELGVTAVGGTTFTPVDDVSTNFSPHLGPHFRYRVRLRPLEDVPMELLGLAFRLESQ